MSTVRLAVLLWASLVLATPPGPAVRDGPPASARPAARAQTPASARQAAQADGSELVRYRREAEQSSSPRAWYNYGTSLLRAGRIPEARTLLRRAAGEAKNPRVERFSRYNYGLASALEGREGSAEAGERRQALLQAREAFREVLRSDPTDEDARWNLEVVERWLENTPRGGGGGSAGPDGAPSSGRGSGQPQGGGTSGDPEEMDRASAEALLQAAGEAESSVRDRLLGRARLRDPVVKRNW